MFGGQPLASGAYLSFEGGENSFLIDATKLEFACPLDLAGMVATANWAAAMDMKVTLKLPTKNSGVGTYLQRMNVLSLMPRGVRVVGRVLPDERGDRAHRLLEVTELASDGQGDGVADKVGHLLTAYYANHSEAAGKAVWQACGELIANAVEHGMSATGAFVAAQTYTSAQSGGPRFEFAICDTGIGVLKHLKLNPRYQLLSRDCIAIERAMEPGVSGTGDDRGNGLSDLIEHTRRYGPIEFQMRSGTGEVTVTGSPESVRTSPGDRRDRTHGTWAWLVHKPAPKV